MGRAVWRGPYVSVSLLEQVVEFAKRNQEWWNIGRFQGSKSPESINTFCRSSTILPDFLGLKFGVHNGKEFINVEVQEAMVGHKLGEFSQTKYRPEVVKKEKKVGGKKINPKTGKAG